MPFSESDDGLFTESQGRHEHEAEVREQSKVVPGASEDPGHLLEVSRDDLVELQKLDESLEPVWRQVLEDADKTRSRDGFFYEG